MSAVRRVTAGKARSAGAAADASARRPVGAAPSIETPVWLGGAPGAWRIRIAAQPGAARSEVVGIHDDCLKLRIAAPPIDGRANDEVLRFIAACLSVPRKRLRLSVGAAARRKIVEADVELDAAQMAACLYQGERP